MKKKLLLMTMFLAMTGMASAQNALTVADFTLPQNGGTITVNLTLGEAGVYTSYQFKVETPTGIAYVVDSDKDAECELSAGHTTSHSATAHWNETERVLGVGVASMKTALFTGQNLSIKIPVAATTLAAGTSVNFAIAENQATGISNVKREAESDDKYYNLKGQRVEKPGKGIYIFKGKKVKK